MTRYKPKVEVKKFDIPEVLSDDGVDDLIEAVVRKAITDYTKALKQQKTAHGMDKADATRRVNECEKFFRSPWGNFLTYGYGEQLIKILRKKVGVVDDD